MAESDDKSQKTEEATPRRRTEARDKGQVAISTELVAAVGLSIGAMTLAFGGGELMRKVGQGMADAIGALGTIGTAELSVPFAAAILSEAIMSVLGALALVTLPAIVLSLLAGYVQVGFQFTPEAMKVEWSKLDPIKGMSKLFSMRSVVRTTMSVVKITLISTVVVAVAWNHVVDLTRVGGNELGPTLAALGSIIFKCVVAGLVVIVALALIDTIYQRYQHGKDLRMTKQEVKEESRLTDGDPHVKARIRRLQHEIATRRMTADVPEATVVVTNPTHYAVALRYERESAAAARSAPVVVAKGVDHVAQRIKEIAAEHGVICYEDVPLARALHAQCAIGEEIPEDLYAAVAAVLGYVYRLRGDAPAMSVGA